MATIDTALLITGFTHFCFLFGKLTQGAVLAQAGLISADLLTASVLLAGLGVMSFSWGCGFATGSPPEPTGAGCAGCWWCWPFC